MVPLPEGLDPAELARARGRGRDARARGCSSVPFVVFQVERMLGGADVRSAEGRDRAGRRARTGARRRCRRALCARSSCGEIAGRLELSEARLAALMAAGPAPAAGARGRSRAPPSPRTSRRPLRRCRYSIRTGAPSARSSCSASRFRRPAARRSVGRPRSAVHERAAAPCGAAPGRADRRAAVGAAGRRRELARIVADLVDRAGPDAGRERDPGRARAAGARAQPASIGRSSARGSTARWTWAA